MAEIIDLRDRRRPAEGSFVCTACGQTFAVKPALERHWFHRPECKASLTRPVGQFGAPTPRQHCSACTTCQFYDGTDPAPCPIHYFRGCPGC